MLSQSCVALLLVGLSAFAHALDSKQWESTPQRERMAFLVGYRSAINRVSDLTVSAISKSLSEDKGEIGLAIRERGPLIRKKVSSDLFPQVGNVNDVIAEIDALYASGIENKSLLVEEVLMVICFKITGASPESVDTLRRDFIALSSEMRNEK